jgi:nitrogen fixation protein FixH
MSRASASRPPRGGRPRQRWIPLLALAPLLALMAADAVMATLAARSDPGLVADAPRRLGLARVAPEATLRLELDATPERRAPGDPLPAYVVRVRPIDADGLPVGDAARVEGRLERTTHAAADRPVRFEPAAAVPGLWIARVAPPDAGAWQVSIAARDAAGRSGLAVLRLAP